MARSHPEPQACRLPDRRPYRPRSGLRRLWLAALALAAVGASSAAGCAASFDPPSKVDTLRVLAVIPTKKCQPDLTPELCAEMCPPEDLECAVGGGAYVAPGDKVEFTMDYVAPPDVSQSEVQITWLGGCFNPVGDEYFGCYASLQKVFEDLAQAVAMGEFPADAPIAQGPGLDRFTLTIPQDIVSSRPVPEVGPHYGISYLFFAACAGTVRPVPPEGTGTAGSFPLGCFDAEGRRLGADSFVPGYTQIYSFADGRTNENPVATGINLDKAPIPEGLDGIPEVKRCPLTEDERRVSGCGAEDPTTACTTYDIEVAAPDDVAEVDADATDVDGAALREAVWVDYYGDAGDFQSDVKLVSDPKSGYLPDNAVKWVPPDTVGPARIWAVVHDARGGASIVERYVRVVE